MVLPKLVAAKLLVLLLVGEASELFPHVVELSQHSLVINPQDAFPFSKAMSQIIKHSRSDKMTCIYSNCQGHHQEQYQIEQKNEKREMRDK